MVPSPPRLLAGNWKMNGSRAALHELALIDREWQTIAADVEAELVFFLPAPLLPLACHLDAVRIGGQDCHALVEGAHTGSVSAALLRDVGAAWVLVGHSECRRDTKLNDGDVAAKVATALEAGLRAMICVGEADRGRPLLEISKQLLRSLPESADPNRIAVAYEPVWAIGTGETPAPAEVSDVMAQLRRTLQMRFPPAGNSISLLYGGSVDARNARSMLVDGASGGLLVGGASLTATSFLPIAEAFRNAHQQAGET